MRRSEKRRHVSGLGHALDEPRTPVMAISRRRHENTEAECKQAVSWRSRSATSSPVEKHKKSQPRGRGVGSATARLDGSDHLAPVMRPAP